MSFYNRQATKAECVGRDRPVDAVVARWNALRVVGFSDEGKVRTGPAGRSSLAAYQTCRAGGSFGRTAWRRPDTGRRWTLQARSAGATRRIRARQGARRTKTVVVVVVRRHVVVAVGRADVRRLIVERAAAQHTTTGSPPSGNGL